MMRRENLGDASVTYFGTNTNNSAPATNIMTDHQPADVDIDNIIDRLVEGM